MERNAKEGLMPCLAIRFYTDSGCFWNNEQSGQVIIVSPGARAVSRSEVLANEGVGRTPVAGLPYYPSMAGRAGRCSGTVHLLGFSMCGPLSPVMGTRWKGGLGYDDIVSSAETPARPRRI